MVYGRVIGNELRDVPPEYLPIWGQRWSGYRAPRGPSPFSTRVFSADRMSEVGPALTSPTQFEVTLAEEEEVEDAGSESSQFHKFFLSSLSATQADTTKPTSRLQTPVPLSVHRSSNYPHDNPEMSHWSTGHPSQTSTRSGNSRQRSELSGTRHSAPDPVSHAIQGGCGSLESDHALWSMDRTTSTRIQLRDGYPYQQHNMSPRSIPGWQFATAHTHSSAHSSQLDTPLHPGNGCLSLPCQVDDQTTFIPTASPPSHRFAVPLPQQNAPVHSSRINMHPGYPMMPPWSPLPDPSLSWPLHNSTSSPELETFYHLASGRHGRSTHPKGFS